MFRGLIVLLLLSGCASRSSLAEKAVASYRQNGISQAIEEENFPIQSYNKNKEAVWQLLDRATIRLAAGDSHRSIHDFHLALDAMDYYRNEILQEQAAQLLIDDKEAAYIAPLYEALFARLLTACAHFQAGDLSNATAILRQEEELESLEKELGNLPKERINPISTYLLAAALEREGDTSQAKLLYNQLGIEESVSSRKNQATLICICFEGLLPEKQSITAPISIISMSLLETLLQAWNIPPAISSLSGIAIPAFAENDSYLHAAKITVDGKQLSPVVSSDVFAIAKNDLDNNLPTIAARAAARQLIRRASVGYAYEKNDTLGSFIDIAMLIANLATTADIRMWHTLPQQLHLYRIDLIPGSHTIKTASNMEQTLHLQAGELCVVQIFRPHGRENHLLIPKVKS